MVKFFPKNLYVTLNGEVTKHADERYFSASKTIDDAYDASDVVDKYVHVAVYELKSVRKVKRTLDWEEE